MFVQLKMSNARDTSNFITNSLYINILLVLIVNTEMLIWCFNC